MLTQPEIKAKKFPSLEKKLGIKFTRPELLVQAFVHRSYLNEHHNFPVGHNERMEFLGDAVLELVITEELFNDFLNPEGELTNWRSALVNAKILAGVAYEIGLEPYLLLSHGEEKDSSTKARDAIMANLMEALIGAIYLDQGYEVSKKFITKWVWSKLDDILENALYTDAKSRFQEAAQEKVGLTPGYKVITESGPDHEKTFKIGVYLDKELVATGIGNSKQEAQTDAAEAGLKVKGWKVKPTVVIRREKK
jgi:ribonuclease-3